MLNGRYHCTNNTRMRHLTLLAAALLCTITSAQLLPATGEFRVNQNVPSEQYLPQVAVGPADDYLVVWKSWLQDNNTASLYFRRYNSAHVALSSELLVATGLNQNTAQVVKVMYWQNGKYIIGWNDVNNVNMVVVEANNTLGAIIPLTGGAEWDFDVNGNTLAFLYGSGFSSLNLHGYDLGTNTFIGSPVLVTEDANNDYDHPNIRFKSNGDLVAIYGRGNYPNRIYRKSFDSDFLAQINETIVHDQNSSLNCIDVSTNASDELLISTKWGVNGTSVYQAWLLDGNGNTIIDELGIFSCSYAYYTSECTLFDNGDFFIVMGNWLSLNDPDDYQVRGFYAKDYNAQNSGVVVLNTTTAGRQVYPAVDKRSDGGFMVVWEGNGFQGDTHGINARAYAGASFPGVQATSNATLVVEETGTTQTLELRLGTQPIGNVVVDLASSDATEATIDVAQMTFTTANWDQPQTVTITGVDDINDDGHIDLNVVATMNVLTADPLYSAMGPEQFAVTNLDDDATFTLPAPPAFCRVDGMAGVNVLVTNLGGTVGNAAATSSDQSVVDNTDITVQQLNATTFAVSIGTLSNNVPGTATITVTVEDANFSYSGSFPVTTLGITPIISQVGGDLTTTPGVAYQWFYEGGFIANATDQTYTPTQNGNHTVLVVDANGCSETSAPFNYLSTGVATAAPSNAFVVAPNPTNGSIVTHTHMHLASNALVELIDAAGHIVHSEPARPGIQTLNVAPAPGVYKLVLWSNGRHTQRVVVER